MNAINSKNTPSFPLGQLLATRGAIEALAFDEIIRALNRHVWADWGDVPEEDRRANDDAMNGGGRLLSAYRSKGGTKFWFITEADRSATTVLLPEEY